MRISWLVLFRRRPPSLVTVTMSSIRTPKRSGKSIPGSIEKHMPGRVHKVCDARGGRIADNLGDAEQAECARDEQPEDG